MFFKCSFFYYYCPIWYVSLWTNEIYNIHVVYFISSKWNISVRTLLLGHFNIWSSWYKVTFSCPICQQHTYLGIKKICGFIVDHHINVATHVGNAGHQHRRLDLWFTAATKPHCMNLHIHVWFTAATKPHCMNLHIHVQLLLKKL